MNGAAHMASNGKSVEASETYEEAIKSYRAALHLNPDDPALYYSLGLIYLYLDRPDDAREQYILLQALDSDLAELLDCLIRLGHTRPPAARLDPIPLPSLKAPTTESAGAEQMLRPPTPSRAWTQLLPTHPQRFEIALAAMVVIIVMSFALAISYRIMGDDTATFSAEQSLENGTRLESKAVPQTSAPPNESRSGALSPASDTSLASVSQTETSSPKAQPLESEKTGKQFSNESNAGTSSASTTADSGVLPSPESAPASKEAEPVFDSALERKALVISAPQYPQSARAAGVSGTVTVLLVVDEDGRVVQARATSGPLALQQAAVQAAYKARFLPRKSFGQAVKISGTLSYTFKPSSLEQSGAQP